MRPIFGSLALMISDLLLQARHDAGTCRGPPALIVGIDAYREITPLRKAVGDAEALSTLEDLGFTVVLCSMPTGARSIAPSPSFSKLVPGDTRSFISPAMASSSTARTTFCLPTFRAPIGPAGFHQGRGDQPRRSGARVASSGAATRTSSRRLPRQSVCANGSRGVGGTRGLTRVEAPAGTFILYSAGYNQTALDRLNDADPNRLSLHESIDQEDDRTGQAACRACADVRSDVEVLAKSAGHEQRPAYYDELSGQFFFKQAEGDEPSPLPQATPAPSPLSQPTSLSEREAFDAAKAVGTEAAWEAFLRRFPSGSTPTLR